MSSEDVNSGHQACTLRAVCHPLGLPTPQSLMEKWSHVIVTTTTRGRYNLALPLLLHHWIIQNNELPGNVMSHTEVTERVEFRYTDAVFLFLQFLSVLTPVAEGTDRVTLVSCRERPPVSQLRRMDTASFGSEEQCTG